MKKVAQYIQYANQMRTLSFGKTQKIIISTNDMLQQLGARKNSPLSEDSLEFCDDWLIFFFVTETMWMENIYGHNIRLKGNLNWDVFV